MSAPEPGRPADPLRPPPARVESAIMSAARNVARLEARLRRLRKAVADAEAELYGSRRSLRLLVADAAATEPPSTLLRPEDVP